MLNYFIYIRYALLSFVLKSRIYIPDSYMCIYICMPVNALRASDSSRRKGSKRKLAVIEQPFLEVMKWKNGLGTNIPAKLYRVFIEYCIFPRILESLPTLPRQHSAAIGGCTKNYQPM